MPPVKRDTEELKEILVGHSVVGYPVKVPILGSSVIVRQEGTGPVRRYTASSMELGSPQVAYIVAPDHPVPFWAWAEGKGLSNDPMTYKQWLDKYEKRTRAGILPMLMETREDLERGQSVSETEAELGLMRNSGCIGPDETVSCATFWSDQVSIPDEKLKRGMLVDFHFSNALPNQRYEKGSIPGRIVGVDLKKKIALLEVFTPLPYMDAPDAIDNASIKKGFYSSKTYSIGYGTRYAFEDAKVELPPGKLSEDERQYILEDLVDISVIEDFCSKHYPNDPHCLWMSLLFYIVPIALTGKHKGEFRPLPENMVTSEYVVDYEHE